MNENTTENTTAAKSTEATISSKFHAAVNFVPDSGKTVLVRLKELGNTGLTVKVDRSLFGEIPPVKHESFILEAAGLFQLGNYLIPSNAKVLNRELGEAKPFDIKAALEAAKEQAPF